MFYADVNYSAWEITDLGVVLVRIKIGMKTAKLLHKRDRQKSNQGKAWENRSGQRRP
jgi:hypothetical protein